MDLRAAMASQLSETTQEIVIETEKDIPLQEGLRKRTSNSLTRSESSGSTIDSSITSSDTVDDGKFDGNVSKEKATYDITANGASDSSRYVSSDVQFSLRPSYPAHRKFKESPLSSDAIFKQSIFYHIYFIERQDLQNANFISTEDLEKLTLLVTDAKQNGVGVAIATIKMMLTKNMFLFGFVEVDEELVFKTVNAMGKQQHTHLQVASKKLLSHLQYKTMFTRIL